MPGVEIAVAAGRSAAMPAAPVPPPVRKVLVIGSGPIVIGQAAEFDYAGTQACRALRDEGVAVVLINSNPATVMTDPATADRVYVEPLTARSVRAVIERERPDGLLPTLGGQMGLNLAMALSRDGTLERFGVRLLGTPPEAIEGAEDREVFRRRMLRLGEPVPRSAVARSPREAMEFAADNGFPIVLRPAYTLGGTGGGIAHDPAELEPLVERALAASPVGQVLLEESLLGWKEIEFEVLRDGADNCIAVCAMENVDPVGVHTGDSIVVAPTQTLDDRQFQTLRSAALRIVRDLGVEGGCNVQFALRPDGAEYRVIEVNPRVSRSSALASKATGYPIAKIAARIALGRRLDEIHNPVTGGSSALFEPALDYVVVKIPRWPFDKFADADRRLGTQMKATGEVMAIDRSFEGALHKALRSLETGVDHLEWAPARQLDDDALRRGIAGADDRRLFLLAEGLRRGFAVADLARLSGVDPFFLERLRRIVDFEESLRGRRALDAGTLREAKRLGLSDRRIGELTGRREDEVRSLRRRRGIRPTYKMVDTCAGEFESVTPYFYGTYDQQNEAGPGGRRAVVVLGSGPIRIGQGIEFDTCAVGAVEELRRLGYEAVIVNNNPETVSTDFDVADRLYFEPLALEDVLNVIELERPLGVLCQFGGQTAVNLAPALAAAGVPVLGTGVDAVDTAERRERFDALVEALGLDRLPGAAVHSAAEARMCARHLGYPLILRPSYVLGGRAMTVVHDEEGLSACMEALAEAGAPGAVWLDRYLPGLELEVDAVSDGDTVIIPGIMAHVERAGIHSGDSVAVFPAPALPPGVADRVEAVTVRIARALGVRGLLNLQLVYDGRRLYVLEVNPRASRTVPFIARATGLPLTALAIRAAMGMSLAGEGWTTGLLPPPPHVAVKIPVFSFHKLPGVDPALGPEMKSTGEVMAMAATLEAALARGFESAGLSLPERGGGVLLTVADRDKPEAVQLGQCLTRLGYRVYATPGTAAALSAAGVEAATLAPLSDPERRPNVLDALRDGRVGLVVNTYTHGRRPERDGFRIRREAAERGIPCLTSLDTAWALARVLAAGGLPWAAQVRSLQEYHAQAAAGRPGRGPAGGPTGGPVGAPAGGPRSAPAGGPPGGRAGAGGSAR
ncbi:MAG TPA: carbamoyl-phosphate synthase large subunit [Bacillota bacterium]